jgi:hypothetical protein
MAGVAVQHLGINARDLMAGGLGDFAALAAGSCAWTYKSAPSCRQSAHFVCQSPRASTEHECILCLLGKVVTLPLIARRMVQCHKPLYPGQPRDRSRLPCGQMVTRLGEYRIGLEECRFDKKNVSVTGEANDLFDILVRKGAIDDIGNLRAYGDLHDLLFEKAKGEISTLPESRSRHATSIKVSSRAARNVASLKARSHGPIESPMASSLLRHTLM